MKFVETTNGKKSVEVIVPFGYIVYFWDCIYFCQYEKVNDLRELQDNKPLRLELSINYLSRVFREYLAWKKKYDELPQYPQEIIVNMKIGKLCEFFYSH